MLLFYHVCWLLIPAPWAGGWRMKGVWRGWRAIYESAGHASAVLSLKLLSRWRRNTAHTLCEAFLHCSLGLSSQMKHDWEHWPRIKLPLIPYSADKQIKLFQSRQVINISYDFIDDNFSKSLSIVLWIDDEERLHFADGKDRSSIKTRYRNVLSFSVIGN